MKKILLVEDEEIMIELLSRKLKAQGYDVTVARNGQEGLDSMRKTTPDLVIMDLIMPIMDGFTAMEEIQKDEQLKKVPLIVVSNSGQPVELGRARTLGARDWLVKTEFDPQELVEKIRNVFKKQFGE